MRIRLDATDADSAGTIRLCKHKERQLSGRDEAIAAVLKCNDTIVAKTQAWRRHR
jgi:hypothetical protein